MAGVTAGMGNMNMGGPPAPPMAPPAGVPSAFGDSGMAPPPPGPGGAVPGAPNTMPAEPVHIDPDALCDPKFIRISVGKMPSSREIADRCKAPLGVVLTPMATDRSDAPEGQSPVDVVNFGATGIVRCKRCRTYINPFVSWVNNGRQWRCNICGYVNEVPSTYFSHLDDSGQRRDKESRPELSKGSVELVAPSEYMLRPPQAPVYVFVLDVSAGAIASGMLQTAVETIKACLDDLPGQPRTQIGFIAFDSSVCFFNLKAALSQPQMLCVPDLEELFLPVPDDLLVNLGESRHVIDALLDALPTMFANTRQYEAALGPALVAVHRIMGHIGGKLCVFLSSLPSKGEAMLKHRENPRDLGTDKEHHQLNPSDPWYKDKAIEFSKVQICVDLFLFSPQFTDVATLSCLPKYTAGSLQYYPSFHSLRDGDKFKAELTRTLLRPTGFEAVMRVRVTKGLKITNFHGNFFIRGQDLLALPNCHPDAAFAFDIGFDDTALNASVVSIQAALLYTTSGGERRIRVHTMAIPVATIVEEIVSSIDMDCMCNLIARQALDVALKSGLEASRHRISGICVDVLRASTTGGRGAYGAMPPAYGQPPGSQQATQAPTYPESLQLLPLYTMALMKSVIFRGGSEMRPDERSYYMMRLNVMNIEMSRFFIYPRMFALHTMPDAAGTTAPDNTDPVQVVGRDDKVLLPPMQNLSVDRLASDGVFMLENSLEIFLWVGRATNPQILTQLFGYPDLDQVDLTQVKLMTEGSGLAMRVTSLVKALQEDRNAIMQVILVREGDPNMEQRFFRYLIEDRAGFTGGSYSYNEFMHHMHRQTGSR